MLDPTSLYIGATLTRYCMRCSEPSGDGMGAHTYTETTWTVVGETPTTLTHRAGWTLECNDCGKREAIHKH